MSKNKCRVLECNSSDNEYLHKDFHGALCYAIKYLDDTHGPDAVKEYLRRVGQENFSALVKELKSKGVVALENHFRQIFDLEAGKAEFERDGNCLVIRVSHCPAISHLRTINQLFTTRYCETTVNINKAICEQAGYDCSCEYVPGQGRCVQKFWKKGDAK